jgi:pimeloyl-ACP methyl ester carboxylesterase
MPIYQRGETKIHYEEKGTGFPLLMIPGGGLNAAIPYITTDGPFNTWDLSDQFRCITFDLRNAKSGRSSGPVEVDRPWDSYTDDHLGLMDHLGIDKFFVMGFCIGGPFIWNMLKRAPERVVAAVLAQPSGSRPEMRGLFFNNNMTNWGPALCAMRPELNMTVIETFLRKMYLERDDFVFTVTRDFVRECQTPILVLPDDVPAHPYAVAMESAMLAPNSQVSLYPWKDTKEKVPLAVRHIRSFLKSYQPG